MSGWTHDWTVTPKSQQTCETTPQNNVPEQETYGNAFLNEQHGINVVEPDEAVCPDLPALDNLVGLIAENYRTAARLRLKAIEEVEQDAMEKPGTKLDAEVLKCAVTIALAGAGAAVGRATLMQLGGGLSRIAQDSINKVIQGFIKDTAAASTHAALQASRTSDDADYAALRGFFRGQWDTTERMEHTLMTFFLGWVAPRFSKEEGGAAAAEELYLAQEETEHKNKEIQRQYSIQEWLVYLAKMESGTLPDGSTDMDMGNEHSTILADTSRKGVLGLEVCTDRFDKLQIIDAEMDGVGDHMALQVSKYELGKLNIPIAVHGRVGPYGQKGVVRFGCNEAGTFWDQSNEGGLCWLNERLGYPHTSSNRIHANPDYYDHKLYVPHAELKETGIEASRYVFEQDIAGVNLNGMGLAIQTEGGFLD